MTLAPSQSINTRTYRKMTLRLTAKVVATHRKKIKRPRKMPVIPRTNHTTHRTASLPPVHLNVSLIPILSRLVVQCLPRGKISMGKCRTLREVLKLVSARQMIRRSSLRAALKLIGDNQADEGLSTTTTTDRVKRSTAT